MSNRNYPFNLDASKVIEVFGGTSAIKDILEEAGCHVSERAIRKWRERQTVPADAIILLHFHASKNGGPDILSMIDW